VDRRMRDAAWGAVELWLAATHAPLGTATPVGVLIESSDGGGVGRPSIRCLMNAERTNPCLLRPPNGEEPRVPHVNPRTCRSYLDQARALRADG
jgi:hypothetical protein